MRTATGTYTGNGSLQKIDLAFYPRCVIIFAPNRRSLWWNKEAWSERTNSLDAQLSMKLAIDVDGMTFYVGAGDPGLGATENPNSTGVVYHWLAFGPEAGEDSHESWNYIGNKISGRVLPLVKQATPAALFIKRDTAAAGVVKALSGAFTTITDGSGSSSTQYILSLNNGSFTVDDTNNVNQLAGNLGEATQVNAFYNGVAPNVSVVTWTGNGAATQTVAGGAGTVKAALLWPENGSLAVRFKTDQMAGDTTLSATSVGGANTGEASLSGANLVVAGNLNQAGLVYFATVFGADTGNAQASPLKVPACAPGSGRKVVYLPGRDVASHIDCGVGSASLAMPANTPNSFELLVSTAYLNSQANDTTPTDNCPLFCRSDGAPSTGTNISWFWMIALMTDDLNGSQGLCGATHVMAATNFTPTLGNGAPNPAGLTWRTGIVEQAGHRFEHLMFTHDGNGRWSMYRDGDLIKRRDIDMRTNADANGNSTSRPNLTGRTVHRTMFGGRWSSTAGGLQGPHCRMKLALARVYNVELTAAQVQARYQRAALGLTAPSDVTPLEEWDANNASGTSLPATVNAANNGTIGNGSVITL